MDWMDTQTQEMLSGIPRPKLAPPKAAQYGLVLLDEGDDFERLVRAIVRINRCSESEATALALQQPATVIHTDLEYEEALAAQFELVCCGAISAFIPAEVLEQAGDDYLAPLFQKISESPEFQPSSVLISEIPITEQGRRFADQFFGISDMDVLAKRLPLRIRVPLKKARIMKHWAVRLGADLECIDLKDQSDW